MSDLQITKKAFRMVTKRWMLFLVVLTCHGYTTQASTSLERAPANGLERKTQLWTDKIQYLHKLRKTSLNQAKNVARVYIKDSALLVRSAAVDILAESLLPEDVPLLKEQLKDERNYYKGRALFVVERIHQLLSQVDPNLLKSAFN